MGETCESPVVCVLYHSGIKCSSRDEPSGQEAGEGMQQGRAGCWNAQVPGNSSSVSCVCLGWYNLRGREETRRQQEEEEGVRM